METDILSPKYSASFLLCFVESCTNTLSIPERICNLGGVSDYAKIKILNDAVIHIKMHLADIGYILHYGRNEERARDMLIALLDMSVLSEPVLWTGMAGMDDMSVMTGELQSKVTPFWQSEFKEHVLETWEKWREKTSPDVSTF